MNLAILKDTPLKFNENIAATCPNRDQWKICAQAVFNVDLTFPSGYVGLGNTPPLPLTVMTADGLQRQWHEPTPIMSPYLLAIAIGDMVPQRAMAGHSWSPASL